MDTHKEQESDGWKKYLNNLTRRQRYFSCHKQIPINEITANAESSTINCG